LAKQYELAYQILITFSSELEMSQKVLVDFCKLAGLLESPGFLRTLWGIFSIKAAIVGKKRSLLAGGTGSTINDTAAGKGVQYAERAVRSW
jgi:hypothetical protein